MILAKCLDIIESSVIPYTIEEKYNFHFMFKLPPTAAEVGESPERLKRRTLSNSTAIVDAERQENDRESRAISRQYLRTVLLS